MKTVIIHEKDFKIGNVFSIDKFNKKLQKINEPFEVKFDCKIKKYQTICLHIQN